MREEVKNKLRILFEERGYVPLNYSPDSLRKDINKHNYFGVFLVSSRLVRIQPGRNEERIQIFYNKIDNFLQIFTKIYNTFPENKDCVFSNIDRSVLEQFTEEIGIKSKHKINESVDSLYFTAREGEKITGICIVCEDVSVFVDIHGMITIIK